MLKLTSPLIKHCIVLYALPSPGIRRRARGALHFVGCPLHFATHPRATSSSCLELQLQGLWSQDCLGAALYRAGAVADHDFWVFFPSGCVQLCIYLLVRTFSGQLADVLFVKKEKVFLKVSWHAVHKDIYMPIWVYMCVCVCVGVEIDDREFMIDSQFISLYRHIYRI